MKLLLYSHYFAPSIGGVETIVRSLAGGLFELRDNEGRHEFDVAVVTNTPSGGSNDSSPAYRVVRQPTRSELWRLIRGSDVVHIAGPALAPLVLSLIARKPVVIEHHGFQTICPNGQLFFEPDGTLCPGHFMAGRHSECLRCNRAQGWISSSKLWLLTFVRDFLSSRTAANITPTNWLDGLLHLPNTIVIAHGIDGSDLRSYPRTPNGTPIIAFQGRLVTTKGARVLLQAAKILRETGRSFELLVIGDGPERSSLEQLAGALEIGGLIRFTGRLTASGLQETLRLVSIMVVPSLAGEVFGLVVAENMSRGLAVVVSDLGAFAEVLGDSGVKFRTGDPAALADALAHLLDDPQNTARLGQLARTRVIESFSLSRMIEQHVLVYRRVLAG